MVGSPIRSDTDLCGGCGHVRWRHLVTLRSKIACLVPKCGCRCIGGATWVLAKGPDIKETLNNYPVPQPAPPKTGFRWQD